VDRGLKKNFCGGQAAAFTLVEVMVTLTIMGFILLMIFGAFRLGIAAWEKGETNKEAYQRTRIASQLISQQMKSAVPYKIKTQKAEGDYLAFEGKARSLKFVSALSLKAKKASGLVYAFYEFREGGKGGGRLILYEGRVLNKNFLEENPPEDAAVPIFEGLADVRFEYYREEDPEKNRIGGWVEEWSAKEEKELPAALRLTLLSQKGGGKSEGVSTMILASLPSNRYEEVRTGPVRRMVPPITR
jgi:general secretion pathway protein J